jgi:hypothetical protein
MGASYERKWIYNGNGREDIGYLGRVSAFGDK